MPTEKIEKKSGTLLRKSQKQTEITRDNCYVRPGWTEYWLNVAQAVSLRSHDAQTQIGSVIVNKFNHILAVGFNGFPAGVDDSKLPNIRPWKHEWIVHSEINALSNATQDVRGATLYITGFPCRDCLEQIWQSGIREIYTGLTPIQMIDEEMMERTHKFLDLVKHLNIYRFQTGKILKYKKTNGHYDWHLNS